MLANNAYYSDAKNCWKLYFRRQINVPRHGSLFFSYSDLGICRTLFIAGIPLITLQYNPNFKFKIFFLGVPLLTLRRRPQTDEGGQPLWEKADRRRPRIYINVGPLPFFDNNSGIPRVAKKLSQEGLLRQDVDVFPVYPDVRTGGYRMACLWSAAQGYTDAQVSAKADPVMTVAPGDWLVHVMINPNELEFNARLFEQMRAAGLKIGFVLYDIIPLRRPDCFRRRDTRIFSRWIRLIDRYDGIFAISKATLDDYRAWRNSQGLKAEGMPFCGVFHLGADFSRQKLKPLTAQEEHLLCAIGRDSYYLQVSTVEPRKGYAQLVAAFDLLWQSRSELKLVLVGRQGWCVHRLCWRMRHHLEYNKRLFWLNRVSDSLLDELYRGARGVVVASEMEGFGLSLVEGDFYGKQLIARDLSVFREIAKDIPHYFTGTAPEALASAIRAVEKQRTTDAVYKPASGMPVLTWKESFNRFAALVHHQSQG